VVLNEDDVTFGFEATDLSDAAKKELTALVRNPETGSEKRPDLDRRPYRQYWRQTG
jgi:hypothetical protein